MSENIDIPPPDLAAIELNEANDALRLIAPMAIKAALLYARSNPTCELARAMTPVNESERALYLELLDKLRE